MSQLPNDIAYFIELRGVYDGWSIAAHKDGSLQNRWADEDGQPIPGYERRWLATENAIGAILADRERGTVESVRGDSPGRA